MLLVLAAGCGLVASIGINQAMSRPNVEQIPSESAEIFVAKTEIGMGDALKPDVLKLESWPKDKMPLGALTKLEETVDRRTRTKIYPGEPIIEAKLLSKGEDVADAANLIPTGLRVVSIRVDAVSGAASLIKPGDRVDVLVHLQENPSRGIVKTTTKTFLQHVKVFAVDDVFRRENDGGQTVAAKTISLLVTPTQAELVTMASELGTLRLVMRSAGDEDKSDTPGSIPSDLPGMAAAAPSNPILPPAPPPAAAEPKVAEPRPTEVPRDHFKMKMLLGPDDVREVDFEDGHPLPDTNDNSTTTSDNSTAPQPNPTTSTDQNPPSGPEQNDTPAPSGK